jgi:tRNA(Ile2) C34 agmatinyltransferase TiaS
MPDDKPCPFCGQENTSEGPDKCRGADTRIFGEAANEIERLRADLKRANYEVSRASAHCD